MEEENEFKNVKTIELPNGASLMLHNNTKGPRIIFYMHGLSFGADILEENPFEYGCDDWANEEIRMYEQALEIDLKEYTAFIKQCLTPTAS